MKTRGVSRGAWVAALGVGMLLLGAACSSAGQPAVGVGTSHDTTVHVVAKEWAFAPSRTSIPAGNVTFELENQGRITHEMVVLKTDLPAKGLSPRADNPALIDEAAAGQVSGTVQDVGVGLTKTETLNLTPGRYLLICNQVGHYKVGMVSEFTVAG